MSTIQKTAAELLGEADSVEGVFRLDNDRPNTYYRLQRRPDGSLMLLGVSSVAVPNPDGFYQLWGELTSRIVSDDTVLTAKKEANDGR